jgi:hypothetical protein
LLDNQSLGKQGLDSNDYKDQERSYKRHYYDTSSASDNHHRTKCLKHHASHRSFQSSETSQPVGYKLTDFKSKKNENHYLDISTIENN